MMRRRRDEFALTMATPGGYDGGGRCDDLPGVPRACPGGLCEASEHQGMTGRMRVLLAPYRGRNRTQFESHLPDAESSGLFV